MILTLNGGHVRVGTPMLLVMTCLGFPIAHI